MSKFEIKSGNDLIEIEIEDDHAILTIFPEYGDMGSIVSVVLTPEQSHAVANTLLKLKNED